MYGLGGTWGTGGCAPWSQPFDNSGGQVCSGSECVAGGKGCMPIWSLYPVYFMIGGGALLLSLMFARGRR